MQKKSLINSLSILCLGTLVCLLTSAYKVPVQINSTEPINPDKTCPVIPLPANFSKLEGHFQLTDQTMIQAEEPSLYPLAHYLQKELLKHRKIALRIGDAGKSPAILLKLNSKKSEENGRYELNMNSRLITITASGTDGLFNGISTL